MCFLFAIVYLVLLTISCASPKKETLFIVKPPEYTGEITPVIIPILPEYKPAAGKIKIRMIVGVAGSNENSITEGTAFGFFQVSQVDDSLIWNYEITKMKKESRSLTSTFPLIYARMKTDKFGVVEENKISFPGLDKIYSDTDEVQRRKFNEEYSARLKKYVKRLPTKPIKSGDIFGNLMNSSQLEETVKDILSIDADIELPWDSEKFQGFNLVLKGWSHYKNRKVLVSTINDSFLLETQDVGVNFFIKTIGYTLLDWDTFHTVKSDMYTDIKIIDVLYNESVNVQSLMTMDAELND